MFKNALIAAGLAGLVFAAQPAFANSAAPGEYASDVVDKNRLVQFGDLDLSTVAGQAKLDARLRRAASAVCDATHGPRPLAETMEARRCYRNAVQAAQREMADRSARVSTVRVASR